MVGAGGEQRRRRAGAAGAASNVQRGSSAAVAHVEPRAVELSAAAADGEKELEVGVADGVEVADAQRRRHAHVDLAQRILDDVVAAAAQDAPRDTRRLGARRRVEYRLPVRVDLGEAPSQRGAARGEHARRRREPVVHGVDQRAPARQTGRRACAAIVSWCLPYRSEMRGTRASLSSWNCARRAKWTNSSGRSRPPPPRSACVDPAARLFPMA